MNKEIEPRIAERLKAIILANRLLEQPSRDPDDDLSVLSRQFLRERERLHHVLVAIENAITAYWSDRMGAERMLDATVKATYDIAGGFPSPNDKPVPDPRALPTKPGFYWAKWTEVDQFSPIRDQWLVVDVEVISGRLQATIPGIEDPRPLDKFIWGFGPLPEPKG